MKADSIAILANARKWPYLVFIISIVYFIFSLLIPPFQSPDEFDHLKRAYLLSEGQIILDSPTGESSGGMIDIGLASFIDAYKMIIAKPERKLSADEIAEADSIRWVGQRTFSSAPGTGYYLPVLYLPQAIGLKVGEGLGLSVDSSYRLARLSTLIIASLLIFVSFRLYAPSPLVLALLLLPMSIFQMASTSLDVTSTALAIFVISLFMRLAREGEKSSPALLFGFAGCVFFLVSSKIHLLPLLGLLFFLGLYTKNKKGLVVGAVVLSCVFIWLLIAVKSTVDLRVVTGSSTSQIVSYYLVHPWDFFKVLAATIPGFGLFYINSFIGTLGWLDTPLPADAYSRLYILLFCVLLCSISFRAIRVEPSARLLLASCAVISALLVFFALLITWNAHPANVIQGVQGRYFLISALLLAYALGGGYETERSLYSMAGIVVLTILLLVSTYSTAFALLDRYYLARIQPVAALQTQMQVSPSLTAENPIRLAFSAKNRSESVALKRVGVLFATYAKSNVGEAELRLSTALGERFVQRFTLSDLADNQYRYFDLEAGHFTAGEIASISGVGVSVWEGLAQPADANSCLIFEYIDGRRITTLGCPKQ